MLDGNLSTITRGLGSETTEEAKMYFQSSLTVFSLMMLVTLSCAHTGLQPAHIYCGRKLTMLLPLVCPDELQSESYEAGTLYNSILPKYNKEQENHPGWPRSPVHTARDLDIPYRLVMDCCIKVCSNEELLSFCS